MKKLFALLVSLCLVFSCACASAATFSELQDMLRNGSSEDTHVEPADAEVPVPRPYGARNKPTTRKRYET